MTHSGNENLSHNQVVDRQFSSQAAKYLTSSVHATGQEFAIVDNQLRQFDQPHVLDLGCGAGHISFCVAPVAKTVIAYDLSVEMLKVVEITASKKGLDNINTVKGIAESLPFADNSFDIVISRFSAHHWQDVPLALREMRRVCQPNGRIIIIDIMAPANPLCDTFLQTIEILRDNSHVRDYSAAEWQLMLSQAGLAVNTMQTHKLLLEFASWISRMRTPTDYVKAIQALQQQIGQEVRKYYNLQSDGSFTTDVVTLTVRVKLA